MNRLTVNSKYENRYLLTEEISFDSKTGNQVWAVIDSETGKRLLGRFQGSGKVEWFADTRPNSTNNSKKVEQNKPIVVLPSGKSATSNNDRTPTFVVPTNNKVTKPSEKNQPFTIPQINKKSGLTSTIKTPKLKIEPENNINKNTTKLPLYIGLSLLILCIALFAYDKREIIFSKIEQPKIEEIKIDSTVNVIKEKEVVATPNLPKVDIEKPKEEIIEDTLKPNTVLQTKTENVKNNNLPKKVKRKKAEKTPENGGFIKL